MSSSVNRPSFSCTPCRSRKVRCDRKRNCGNCQRRGEACVWPEDAVLWGEEGLRERVERLETIILAAGLEQTVQSQVSETASNSSGEEQDVVAIDKLFEQQTDVTHHDDFDHQIISSKKRKTDDSAHFNNATKQPIKAVQEVLLALPSKSRCDQLVNVYFDRVEWIHHVIHRPSFQDWYSGYWVSGLGHSNGDLHSLALLFSMLCLALHFDDRLSTPQSGVERRFFDASFKALQLGDYLSFHSIALLQTLIMQGLWLNDMGMSEMHHANLGLAIRIANLMGLSRLDAVRNNRLMALSRDENGGAGLIDKEMMRRIYWSLYCQDCYTASSCNFTYLIQSSQIKVKIFANIADEELA